VNTQLDERVVAAEDPRSPVVEGVAGNADLGRPANGIEGEGKYLPIRKAPDTFLLSKYSLRGKSSGRRVSVMTPDTPSPEQAAHELSEISDRQQQAAAKAARLPEWLWWSVAAATILSGLAADLWPSLGGVPGLVVVGLAVLLVLGIRSKRIATAMGFRAAPDRQSVPRKAVGRRYLLAIACLALALLMVVGATAVHVPFMHTIASAVMAAVLVLVLRPVVRSLLNTAPGER
jgi:hypothetical protein